MKQLFYFTLITAFFISCGGNKVSKTENKKNDTTSLQSFDIKLITLDPGHFHAALVQKKSYAQISPYVFVYAPAGADLDAHLKRIEGYNLRAENPTKWNEKVYTGADYLDKMLNDKAGNVVVLSGNNRIKTDYILKSVAAGYNVLADKPMVILPENFPILENAFKIAEQKNVMLYDIMTERYEITTILQKELSQNVAIFGKLRQGTVEMPAVEKVSVHHFYKNVSGNPLVRPAWFFDVAQQGEGIVDVTTHLVDLVQWGCFPEQIIQKSDIEMISAKRWATIFTPDEFKGVTQLDQFPDYLQKNIKGGNLNVFANGEMVYKIKNCVAKVAVEWRYKAPEGGGDTHYSIMRGTKCSLEIKQGAAEKYLPTLYLNITKKIDNKQLEADLSNALKSSKNSDLTYEKVGEKCYKIVVPARYNVGHEAHFAQVTEKFLEYLKQGKLPEWEVPNMIAKYYTTTLAYKMAHK